MTSYGGMGLRGIILELHVYAGLLTFGQLMIYGVTGLSAAFQPGLERPKIPHTGTRRRVSSSQFPVPEP